MITRFKIFENVSQPPEIGDYVIIDCRGFEGPDEKELYDLYSNNVGKIISGNSEENRYEIQWEKVPDFSKDKFKKDYFKKNIREYHSSWLMYWSDNKEEIHGK